MSTRMRLYLISGLIVAILLFLIIKNKAEMNASNAQGSIATAYSVSVIPAVRQSADDRVSVVGTLNGFNDVVVLSETQGRVVKVDVEVGDYKAAGAVLVEVDSELKEAAFKAAEVTYEKAKKDLERYQALIEGHSISDTQFEQARWTYQSAEAQYVSARRQLSDTKITTPIAGIVTARFVNVGTMVMGAPQATQIAEVVDVSKLKAKVNVAEADVFRLRVGDPAEISTDVFPETVFAGSISTISSKGDEGHTYPVEVLLGNPKRQLKAGMFVSITIKLKSDGPALLIPREALLGSIQDASLYIVKDNIAKIRRVVATKQIGTSVEISGGLQQGELVVVDGQDNLSDGASVIIRK